MKLLWKMKKKILYEMRCRMENEPPHTFVNYLFIKPSKFSSQIVTRSTAGRRCWYGCTHDAFPYIVSPLWCRTGTEMQLQICVTKQSYSDPVAVVES